MEEEIDEVLLHRIGGPIATFLSFLGIFGILLILGNEIQRWLTILFESLVPSTSVSEPFLCVLNQGLNGLMAGVAIPLPYVFLFYFLLGLMEDVGLLIRFIVNLDRFLRKLGLSGKSFIPLALGLGCTAPAARATRVLSSKKEQFHVASFFAFVPCSSRIAIIMGVVGFYGSIEVALSVFLSLLLAGLKNLWVSFRMKLTDLEGESLLLELPPYRRPLMKNVLTRSWIWMKDFVYIVIPLLMAGGILYGVLKLFDLYHHIIGSLSPICSWLGLPNPAIIPLVFGFLQKDLTGAMLVSALGNGLKQLPFLQLFSFGAASAIGIPCIIAFGMLWREFGMKKTVLLTVGSIAYGLLFAGLIWRIASILI